MTRAPLVEGVRDLTEIGRGGFGIVYRGTEVEFGRDVAVKVLMQLQNDRAKRRFDRERRAMGAVSDHENIVTVYRGGVTATDEPYLVMEYVRGGSLSDRLNTIGPLAWRQAAEVGAKLADALSVAHRAGILHRDVKPGNVFMTENGEPKLGDFGIAVLDDGLASRTAGITASVAHAPPEIVDGQRGDERSDIYSLASTIYALTNGAAPFSRDADDGLAAMLSRIAKEEPRPLHLESAASHFESVVLKGLSKRPEERHATVAEFGNELRRAALVTVDVPQPVVPMATNPANPATPPGFVPVAARAAAPAASAATTVGAPARQVSTGQLAFFAVLLLAIAAFGGWAVSRAVFGSNDDSIALSTPTSAPVATAVEPTPAPAPTPQPSPSPNPAPSSTATPVPGSARELGSRDSRLPEGFRRVGDVSGAIQLSVPVSWAESTFDLTDFRTGQPPIPARALAIGGTVRQDGDGVDLTSRREPGIYIFAERSEGQPDPEVLLDLAVNDYGDCLVGLRSEFPLFDGTARSQILECDLTDGVASAGVILLALVPENDPNAAVTIAAQLVGQDPDEMDASITELFELIVPSIRINSDRLPDPETFVPGG